MMNLVLDGQSAPTTATSTVADIFWRWEDDKAMEPQFLGRTAAGHDLIVPFDLKGKSIRLFMVSKTAAGYADVRAITEAEQVVYAPVVTRDVSIVQMAVGQDLAYGDLVYVYDDSGTPTVRQSTASDSTKPADGWATATYTTGDDGLIALTGTLITGLSGLTIGADYYLSDTAGAITTTAPSASGHIVQRVGFAVSATVLSFERGEVSLIP